MGDRQKAFAFQWRTHARKKTLIASFLSVAVWQPAFAEDCSLKNLATLDMRTQTNGPVTVPVNVNGHEFYFRIATGDFVNSISSGVVEALQLPSREARNALPTLGGTVLHQAATAKDFSIGSLTAHRMSFYVQPSTWPGDGTIGSDLLRNYDVDFDFAGGKLNLVSPDHCRGKVVYWTKDPVVAIVPISVVDYDGVIRVPVILDGKTMTAEIDTGEENSYMGLAAAGANFDLDEHSPGMTLENEGNGTGVKAYRYPFKSLDFEGVAVSNPNIGIEHGGSAFYMGSTLILGMDVLRQLHMYIAYKEGKMYLTAATAH